MYCQTFLLLRCNARISSYSVYEVKFVHLFFRQDPYSCLGKLWKRLHRSSWVFYTDNGTEGLQKQSISHRPLNDWKPVEMSVNLGAGNSSFRVVDVRDRDHFNVTSQAQPKKIFSLTYELEPFYLESLVDKLNIHRLLRKLLIF